MHDNGSKYMTGGAFIRLLAVSLILLVSCHNNVKGESPSLYIGMLPQDISERECIDLIDASLPPIIAFRYDELQEFKENVSALQYAELCLHYIDRYYDEGFTWYVDYGTEETIRESRQRSEKLIRQGWTGNSIEPFICANNILDIALQYMIAKFGYFDLASPILLYREAKGKLELGDYHAAVFYSKMAKDLYRGLSLSLFSTVDNLRVLALSNELANNDTSTYPELEKDVHVLEKELLNMSNEKDYVGAQECLIDSYCALAGHERRTGNYQQAEFWINQALHSLGGNARLQFGSRNNKSIPVYYNKWQNALASGDTEMAEQVFDELFSEIHWRLGNNNTFDFHDITFEVERKFLSERSDGNEDEILERSIKESVNIRELLSNYCALMHPKTRDGYYVKVQQLLGLYNGILANNCRNISSGYNSAATIFNNLLATRGLQLLNEKLLAQALSADEECRSLNSQLDKVEGLNNKKFIALFRSELYRKKLEEKALVSQGLKDMLSLNFFDIQSKLQNKDAVIEFFKAPFWRDRLNWENETSGQYGLYAALLTYRGDPQIIPLCSINELPLSDSKRGYSLDELACLSGLIWQPLMPYLNGVARIYFVPDAELHNFPVEYLPIGDGAFIFDKFDVSRLSSSRELVSLRDTTPLKDIALFGDMRYSAGISEPETALMEDETECDRIGSIPSGISEKILRGLRGARKDLTNTKEEINRIHRIAVAKGLQGKVFSGLEATEGAFKALSGNAPSIIHLATHGAYWPYLEVFDDRELMRAPFFKNVYGEYNFEDPLGRSVLMFTGANKALCGEFPDSICSKVNARTEAMGSPIDARELEMPEEDGVLTAREISMLDLSNVDLIVLSACQTGLGDIAEDGIFGLQRGIKKAGAGSILMSLWEVEDDATQKLMTSFYKYLFEGYGKNEALKKAQKDVRETPGFSHPDYWAAFILLDGLN